MLNYPADYFDPEGNAPLYALCTECGRTKSVQDFNSKLEEVQSLFGVITYEGVCIDCKDEKEHI